MGMKRHIIMKASGPRTAPLCLFAPYCGAGAPHGGARKQTPSLKRRRRHCATAGRNRLWVTSTVASPYLAASSAAC